MGADLRYAALFPGQGSQYVGMGRDLLEHADVREIGETVRSIIGTELLEVVDSGSDDDVRDTRVAQPAIMVVSLVAYRLFEAAVGKPVVGLGHSLGEYTALSAAGAFDIATALTIVSRRAQLMQAADPSGGMIAVIGLECQRIERIIRMSDAVIANRNAPDQVIVSGARDVLRQLEGALYDAGARRVVHLNVSGAFHSPRMSSASEGLAAVLDAAVVEDPEFPVLSNVTATEHHRSTIRDQLVMQMTHGVRWTECVEKAKTYNPTHWIEFGPGRVLSGLVVRCGVTAHVLNVENLSDLKNAIKEVEAGAVRG